MEAGNVRLDRAPRDPSWAPPVGNEPAEAAVEPPRRRGPLIITIGVVVLALLGAGLWVGGAFRDRTDYGWTTAPGTTITAGPFELSFTGVTVQQTKDYDDKLSWEVRVAGTGRSTADETLVPSTFDESGVFLLRDPATRAIYRPEVIYWGTNNRIGDGSGFTPGLPPVPFSVKFTLPESYVPAATLTFGAFDQELRDNSLLKNQEPTWRNAVHYYRYELSVQRLPDDDT